jgi:hypothetical protein
LKEFFKVFRVFFLIAIAMFLASATLNWYESRKETSLDARVTEAVQGLDDLYAKHPGTQQKRDEIAKDLRSESRSDFTHLMLEHLAEALLLAGFMIVTAEAFTRHLSMTEMAEGKLRLEEQFTDQNVELDRKFTTQTTMLTTQFSDQTGTLAKRFEEQERAFTKKFDYQTEQFQKQTDLIAKNVWNSIFNRMVPPAISTEIEGILKSKICRVGLAYTVILSNKDYVDVPEGYVVVKRQMVYRLFNLTGSDLPETIRFQTRNSTVGNWDLTTRDGETVTLPRILNVSVHGEEIDVPLDERTDFTYKVKLPQMASAKEAWQVDSEVEGLSLTTDRVLYMQPDPCDGLEVRVFNLMEDTIKVQDDEVYVTGGHHLSLTTKKRWVCNEGILTGIALSIPWRAIPKRKI